MYTLINTLNETAKTTTSGDTPAITNNSIPNGRYIFTIPTPTFLSSSTQLLLMRQNEKIGFFQAVSNLFKIPNTTLFMF